jgi:hypothetical protein
MTDLQTAITNLKTHLQGVQIGGADVFPSGSVYLTTDPPTQQTRRFPRAIIRISNIRPHTQYPADLQFVDISVELQQEIMAGKNSGEKQVLGGHDKDGIEDIRMSVIGATANINSASSPAIAPWLHLVGPGGAPASAGGGRVTVMLDYEALLEV